MRVSLIVNPTASSVTATVTAAVGDALGVGHDLVTVETSARDHASELARAAAADGVDVVVVLAGDGTLNEAAQGLAGTRTALAPLPGGSTNVFARAIGVEFGPFEACAQLLRSLAVDTRRPVGLGRAHPPDGAARAFLFHLGLGFDAAIVREMEQRHTHLKRHLAHPAFAATTVATWIHHYDRDTRIHVDVAGDGSPRTSHADGPYAVVSNCDPYTYVGRCPVTLAPDASLDRPLAVTTFDSLAAPLLVRAAISGLTGARFLDASPRIAQFADVSEVVICCDRPTPWQVDGDHLGSVTELRVDYEPDALTLLTPATPRARRRGRR